MPLLNNTTQFHKLADRNPLWEKIENIARVPSLSPFYRFFMSLATLDICRNFVVVVFFYHHSIIWGARALHHTAPHKSLSQQTHSFFTQKRKRTSFLFYGDFDKFEQTLSNTKRILKFLIGTTGVVFDNSVIFRKKNNIPTSNSSREYFF